MYANAHLFCAQCGIAQSELKSGTKIKRCGRCRLRGYCSINCQRVHWITEHGEECQKLCEYREDHSFTLYMARQTYKDTKKQNAGRPPFN